MRILVVHNAYQQAGGEDEVFAAETALLEEHGHQVFRYEMHNDSVTTMSRMALARATLWNSESYRALRALVQRERPQVAHFHNTFPLVSPAGYYAARAEGVPVVQTLHNYRLLCPNSLFFRDGHPCEDCLGKAVPWPGVLHACYRNNRPASGVVATMLATHRALRTWTDRVDVFVALTEFARQKFVEGGLPSEKVVVKPNFLPPVPAKSVDREDFFLFVGRLSREKGVETLLRAWEQLEGGTVLKIIGDGPLAEQVADAAKRSRTVRWLGRQPKERVLALMRTARALVFPSVWYEGFPMVILEAGATGLPVIASDLGSMSSLVVHGRTGLHFRSNDAEDLAGRVEWARDHPEDLNRLGVEAQRRFDSSYTAEQNYDMLMSIYERVANGG